MGVIANNEKYRSLNGVLYSADLTELLYVPPMSIFQTNFIIPPSVKTIARNAFRQASKIRVKCSQNVTEIVAGAFMYSKICELDLWDTKVSYECWEMPEVKHIVFSQAARIINAGTIFRCPKLEKITVHEDAKIQPELTKKYVIIRRR